GKSQEEGLGSEHGQIQESRASGGPRVPDDSSRSLRGSAARGQASEPPAEFDDGGGESREVGSGAVLPGLDAGSLEQQGVRLELEEQHLHVGPLPSPDALAAYEAVAPGCAERIIRVMERTILGEED